MVQPRRLFQPEGGNYVVVKDCVVRKDVALDSEKLGLLTMGERVRATESQVLGGGHVRCCFPPCSRVKRVSEHVSITV